MIADLVVAQYRENIDWLRNIKSNYIRNIILYRKYKSSKIFKKELSLDYINPKIVVKQLKNTGRESHSYLTYCVEYYEDLPDAVFFVQGNPFPHGFGDRTITHWLKKIQRINFTHTDNYHKSHLLIGMPSGKIGDWYTPTQPSKFDMLSWFLHYIDNDKSILTQSNNIYFGANFGVSKDRILSRQKTEYENLIEKEFTDKINPEAGHFMERSWYYLFNLHKI